jgi:death-on-curing protein
MTDFRFLSAELAFAVHERQLAEHGGLDGVKDPGLLESAISLPLNKHAYGEGDPCALAAAYAFGIARNHPFNDGNKRTAWVMARLFLRLNGMSITFDKADAIRMVLALAAGELEESAVADWFRARLTP